MAIYQAYPEYKDSGVEWLVKIPVEWNTVRLKYSVDLKGEKVDSKSMLKYVGMENIESKNGKYIDKGDQIAESLSTSFNKGDVLFGKLRPYLAKSWLATFSGICSSEFLVLKSKTISPRFLNYYTLTSEVIKQVDSSTYGSKMPRASWNFIGNLGIPTPPDNTSIQIANFLDHETAKIDTLIEKQQQLIKLLKEKRQAVISHAVTKGLNPNVPMRDSGVEWLGEVPEHWEVKKFKFLCDRVISGPFGSSITKDMYVKYGYKVYGQEQVIPNNFEIGDYYISEKDYLALSRYIVDEGDVLISCVGTFGKIAVYPKGAESGIINPRLIKAKINYSHNPYYIRELLKSEMVFKQFELLSRGGTMGVINIAILNEIMAVVPPPNEQSEIVIHINQQKDNFSNLIKQANKAVKLLQERRTALISAAVTGKIDVRNWKVSKF